MEYFSYQGGKLFAEQVDLTSIIAQYGTPCYVYSRAALEQHWHAFAKPLVDHPHLICYAVKANSNLAVLNLLAHLGSGFDVVSEGELERVLAAGGEASKVVFSGVGKTHSAITRALEVGIQSFNIESPAELVRIQAIATQMNKVATVALRINPDVDAATHPYISTGLKENKFGIPAHEALAAYRFAATLSHIKVIGIHCHIGSQILEAEPFMNAAEKILALVDTLASEGIHLQQINLGGGLGVRYRDELPLNPHTHVQTLREKIGTRNLRLILEPGRAIAANAGILLTRIEYLKPTPDKNFAITDAGMNDLLRPALYDAWQNIIPLTLRDDVPEQEYDVVGPVCETADFLGKNRRLKIAEGDYLAVCSAGAYGFSMSSNYNTRPRTAEMMVDGSTTHLIRSRETLQDLWISEKLLPTQKTSNP